MLVAGISTMVVAIVMTRFSLVDFVLDERSKMSPALPPYNMWLKPDPEVRLSIYIFTVLNAQQFLADSTVKLHVHEIGPIVYRELLHHEDVVHHPENGTMSYTAVRVAEFVDHYNEPEILNRTITVPNFALLVSVYYLVENFFLLIEVNVLSNKHSISAELLLIPP